MNSTFIIVLVLLDLPRNALFCKGFRGYCDMLLNYRLWQIRAELSKLLLPVSSKMEKITTTEFYMSLSKYIFFNTSKIATNDLKSTLSKGGFSSNTIFANVIFDKTLYFYVAVFALVYKCTLASFLDCIIKLGSSAQDITGHL